MDAIDGILLFCLRCLRMGTLGNFCHRVSAAIFVLMVLLEGLYRVVAQLEQSCFNANGMGFMVGWALCGGFDWR